MKKVKIKRFRILSVALMEGALMGFLGVIIVLLVSIIGGIHGGLMAPVGSSSLFDFGIIGIIILPIMFFLLGFLLGGCTTYFYNLIAGWIGGIEIEITE